ncbi:MAG: site-2 protease family protein [Patescibacteria group bacterium]|nr:MAG: site-2 protease family protein [Patescibacteria group bacterium]
MQIDFIFIIAILIMSVVIHEVSHGYVAYMLGDPTAKLAGRLTLNPMSHIDLLGSIVVPLLMYLSTGFIIGWAKPVPYNPYNLKNQRWGIALVGAAGALSNFLLAIVFGLFIRFGDLLHLPGPFLEIFIIIVVLNILLGVFNLLPVPPLDGSKVFFSLLPYRLLYIQDFLERHWLFFIFIVIFFAWRIIIPVVGALFSLITGLPLTGF